MVHARFRTPNRWLLYLTQVLEGRIDRAQFPAHERVGPLLSRFRSRPDIEYVSSLSAAVGYLLQLPLSEYDGPTKAATLLVFDLETERSIEVPDWGVYGIRLEKLTCEERETLIRRGVDPEALTSGRVRLLTNRNGKPRDRRPRL